MELIATSRRDGAPVACAYGATLDRQGRLCVGLLFVMRRQVRHVVTFRDPQTKTMYRVRLPGQMIRLSGHSRVSRIRLEVLP